ncbi:helix-turn-helix domain-containing protein [Deinococcus misasensis]|uniref:helix-turn-helix domain-containing protein n=1 Tax=Deinococcus misasensis TaxID=392413 RepID=UPI0005567552|nr:helix-turn-helix transcriptional regulator [Deinococcus misasensis]
MTREELEAFILTKAKQAPHGFQSQLAARLGVTRSYISHFLTGKSPVPYQHLFEILDALGYKLVLQPKNSDSIVTGHPTNSDEQA